MTPSKTLIRGMEDSKKHDSQLFRGILSKTEERRKSTTIWS